MISNTWTSEFFISEIKNELINLDPESDFYLLVRVPKIIWCSNQALHRVTSLDLMYKISFCDIKKKITKLFLKFESQQWVSPNIYWCVVQERYSYCLNIHQ